MALEIKLNQKLSQSLVMTPQLQQAIKLLQLGRMEYLEVIERELLENPILEDLQEGENQQHTSSAEVSAYTADREGESPNGNGELPQAPDGEFSEHSFSENPENEFKPQAGTELYGENSFDYGSRVRRSDSDVERPSLEATLSSPEGLASHLL